MSEKKNSPEEVGALYANLSKDLADKLLSPSFRSAMLGLSLETMQFSPPKSPRSAKRQQERPFESARRAGYWAAVYPSIKDETIDPIITKALEEGNASEVFIAISEGAKIAESGQETSVFARHVITAMKVASHIMKEEQRIPTKSEIRCIVESVFEKKGWAGFQTEKTRWTEIWAAAHLGDLLAK